MSQNNGELGLNSLNELELRKLLLKGESSPSNLVSLYELALNSKTNWEERRSVYFFLFHSGKKQLLVQLLIHSLRSKLRIPFDLLIELARTSKQEPKSSVIESLIKGLKKQSAFGDLVSSRGWDNFDRRLKVLRKKYLERLTEKKFKLREELYEKYEFLKNQRMTDQAGQVLRRLLQLYPEDPDLQAQKAQFEEQWARDVVNDHRARLSDDRLEKTKTAHSDSDEKMLIQFLAEGEKLAIHTRAHAQELAIAFFFMEDYNRALDILAWAEPSQANDWLRAELLLYSRRFVEGLELLNELEIKFVNSPETTFACAYLRCQCLHALGQRDQALEIMQGIARVRPNYRSAQSLILEWSEGIKWE